MNKITFLTIFIMLYALSTNITADPYDFIMNYKHFSPKALEGELCKETYETIFKSFFPERARRDLLVLAAVKCYNNLKNPNAYDHQKLQEVLELRDSWLPCVKRTQLAAQYYVLTRTNRLIPGIE